MPHYLLHGANSVDLQRQLHQLQQEIDADGYGTSVFHAGEASVGELQAALASPPFFGGVRLIVIHDLFTSTKGRAGGASDVTPDLVSETLADAPASTMTILTHNGKVNKRQIDRFKKRSGAEQFEVLEFQIPRGRELVQWSVQRAANQDVEFPQNAAETMLDLLYPTLWRSASRFEEGAIDPRLIASEIDKLAVGAVDGTITIETVNELVARRSGVTAFRLGDETFGGRPDAALAELRSVLEHGQAPEAVLGQLGYNLSVLMAARVAANTSPQDVSDTSGFSPGQLGMTVSRKNAWRDAHALHKAAEALRRAEWLVKTGRTQNTATLLESTVAEIAIQFRS